jgi:hypothetical protein
MQPPDEALVGTWITADEDSDASFSFSINKGEYEVSGFCLSDGEKFDIADVAWDGIRLSFTAIMPSIKFRSRNSFRVLAEGKIELELTIYETWKKTKTAQR